VIVVEVVVVVVVVVVIVVEVVAEVIVVVVVVEGEVVVGVGLTRCLARNASLVRARRKIQNTLWSITHYNQSVCGSSVWALM